MSKLWRDSIPHIPYRKLEGRFINKKAAGSNKNTGCKSKRRYSMLEANAFSTLNDCFYYQCANCKHYHLTTRK